VKKVEELIYNDIFSIALKKIRDLKRKIKQMNNDLPKDLIAWVKNRIEKLQRDVEIKI